MSDIDDFKLLFFPPCPVRVEVLEPSEVEAMGYMPGMSSPSNLNKCQQGAAFLGEKHWEYREWTECFSVEKDKKCAVNLFDCILVAKVSLEDSFYRSFNPKNIPTFAQTPPEVYQEYLTAFKERIDQDCPDKEVADLIKQYVDAAITQLLSLILSHSSSNSGGPIIFI